METLCSLKCLVSTLGVEPKRGLINLATEKMKLKQITNNLKLNVMLKNCLLVLIVLTAVLTSCQKDQLNEVLFDNETTQLSDATSISDEVSLEIDSTYEVSTKEKKGYSSILRITSFDQIPSQIFGFYSKYRISYEHLKQKPAECSWTSYVIATSCILEAKHRGYYYPVNYSRVSRVKNGCGGSSYIGNLQNYGNYKDGYMAKYDLGSKGNKLDFVKGMLNHINVYHAPFLAITSIGGTGHYVIVFAIDWKKGLNGSTIYYMDPNEYDQGSFYSNLRTMDLSLFLNRMISQHTKCYNALFIKPY